MNDVPLVSIIILAYNIREYIEMSICSAIHQTYRTLEILLIDDGSTDGTGEICDRYMALDDRIAVIHKQNGGLSDARNIGLDNAKGEYVAFLDGDDIYHPRFIETLIAALLDYGCDVSMCGFYCTRDSRDHFIENKSISYEVISGKEASLHCSGYLNVEYNIVWNKLYKKCLFDGIRYPVGRINEDEYVTWKVLWNSQKVVVANALLYLYVQRKDSIMDRGFSPERMQVVEAFIERSRFFHTYGFEKEALDTVITARWIITKVIEQAEQQGKDTDKMNETLSVIEEEIIAREEDYYRFPVEKVSDRKTAVIYGAGRVGRAYYRQAKRKLEEKNIIWVDRFSIRDRAEVTSIDHILDDPDAMVVIAIENSDFADDIRAMLTCMGVKKENIVWEEARKCSR